MIDRTFTRRPSAPDTFPERVVIRGEFDGGWTCTDADEFGGTFILHPDELTAIYDAPATAPPRVSDARGPSAAELRAAAGPYRGGHQPDNSPDPDDPTLPENVFAAAVADAAR